MCAQARPCTCTQSQLIITSRSDRFYLELQCTASYLRFIKRSLYNSIKNNTSAVIYEVLLIFFKSLKNNYWDHANNTHYLPNKAAIKRKYIYILLTSLLSHVLKNSNILKI